MSFIGRGHSREHLTVLSRKRKPLARSEELLVEEVGDEIVVYDTFTHHAHCLSPVAARVWRACDGTSTEAQIAVAAGLDEGTAQRAFDELGACALLQVPSRGGLTRREATAKLAKLGTAAATAPLISSIAAPSPASGQTVNILDRCVGPPDVTGQSQAAIRCGQLGFTAACCYGNDCVAAQRFFCVNACNGAGPGGCPCDQLPHEGPCSQCSSVGGCATFA